MTGSLVVFGSISTSIIVEASETNEAASAFGRDLVLVPEAPDALIVRSYLQELQKSSVIREHAIDHSEFDGKGQASEGGNGNE